mmetsp:Transcript_24319/g.49252  ORF Transcript_24319/g.49252 Transcript_24319/m.49252 type:complete len:279 (-) Transcript_24319:121-957(-)|eukprot:CAMPEP_0183300456 /NCGR_PEP_ID=MMETSP0160_2-20130417/6882_1 /TAXON_ID=2839 ORGANISM="Odontella Sinensis, Strain Grunow 1884" /NCGR_SAMPLE_ID=MMETSP0160_2 /ASSEMBLY_ACC=CAM_ASM_000250 /LENGTH=278 /DNA_ID=CAMNT_0025462881 /DNA_START=73 /DNA_END=909 /DNA_ORIENTATION=+
MRITAPIVAWFLRLSLFCRPTDSFVVERALAWAPKRNSNNGSVPGSERDLPYSHPYHDSILMSNRFDNEYNDKASRRAAEKAAGKGAGEAAAGAVLGAMIGGPFGALFGAQIGANFGSARAFDKAKKDEMEQMGITEDMLKMAEESGAALDRAMEGLNATRDSYKTQQALARRLDSDSDRLYEQAKEALAASNEERAKDLLMERQNMQERLKKALLMCAEERKRVEVQQKNVAALEERAMEIEALLRRGVGAKSLQDSSLSLSSEDPLLQKFKDMGID